jgi:hypothetical protein
MQLVWTVTTALLLRVAQWLIDAGATSPGQGPLYAAYIGLCQTGTPGFTQNTLLSQVTEANYDGYARQEIVWYPPYISTAGPQTLEGGSLFFMATDQNASNNITAVMLVSALTGGVLLAGAALPSPGVVLGPSSAALKVIPEFQLPFQQIYGGPFLMS